MDVVTPSDVDTGLHYRFDNNVIADIQNLYSNNSNKVRSTIKVKHNIPYTILHKGNEVVVTFSRINPLLSNVIIEENLFEPEPPLAAKDINFYRNSQGAGVVEIFLPDDQTQVQVIDNQEKGINIASATNHDHLYFHKRLHAH